MPRIFNPVAGTGGVEQTPLGSPLDFGTDENPMNAFLYYGAIGAADPKNPLVETRILMATTGSTFWPAYLYTMGVGFLVIGTIGTILDPKHKMRGGFDDTKIGASFYGSRRMSNVSKRKAMSSYVTGMPSLTYEETTYKYDPYYS